MCIKTNTAYGESWFSSLLRGSVFSPDSKTGVSRLHSRARAWICAISPGQNELKHYQSSVLAVTVLIRFHAAQKDTFHISEVSHVITLHADSGGVKTVITKKTYFLLLIPVISCHRHRVASWMF